MRSLIDGLQRILATALVAGIYILPASLGGLMTQLDIDLETVVSPERVASFVLDLPAGATIPMLAPDKPEVEEPAPQPQRELRRDMLARPGGVPSSVNDQPRQAAGTKAAKARRKGSGERKGRQAQCMASSGQITATGGDRYQVERALLDHYFRDTEAAARIGSATWSRSADGEIDGIQIRRVRCGGPLEEAGLAQGDIIRSANGKRVDSMAGVIALWWQMRSKDSVKLVITRDGQRKRLRYSLV
jgi:hypothetical protein